MYVPICELVISVFFLPVILLSTVFEAIFCGLKLAHYTPIYVLYKVRETVI